MCACRPIALAAAASFACSVGAQPAPEERLRFFEGTWTTADATPELGFRETCAWLPEGRRHMVCRSRWNTPSGPREGMSVFSFDRASGQFVYNGFRSSGAWVLQRGEEQGGRWRFGSEEGQGEARVRTRVTMEADGDQGFVFVAESSTGDGPWRQTSKVVYRRVP